MRRAFGWADDTRAGGSTFDQITADGTGIPDATQLWPVTNVTVDKGQTNLTRDDEIRNRRGNTAPQEFRQAPTVTVQGRLYPPILKKLIALVTGAAPTITGAAPAAIVSKYEPVGQGVMVLPAVHLTVVRDDLYEKVAGCQLSSLQLTFSKDEHATFQATFVGLYRQGSLAGDPPAADFTYLQPEWVYLLRDAEALIAGAAQGIDGLDSFTVTFDNQHEDPEFFPMQNREITAGAVGERDRVIWWPARRRLGAAQQVSGQIGFSDVKTAEEQAADLVQARQLVFEVDGDTLDTTPPANGMFRFTGNRAVYTGGGASDLQRDGLISSQYDLGVFVDETTGKDVSFEITEAPAT